MVRELLRSPVGVKLMRYSAVSVISLFLSEALLVLFSGAIGWSAAASSTAATGLATIPAYYMNRQWVWSRNGRSHFWREVAPFWVLAIVGWAFATGSVALAEHVASHHSASRDLRVLIIAVTYVASYGVLWVGKFILFNKVIFVHRPEARPEALDGRTGFPS